MSRGQRRAKGEGSIFQRSDGRWTAEVTIGYDQKGKQRRKTVYGKTQRDVVEKKRKIEALSSNKTIPTPERLTLEAWLLRHIELRKPEVRPRTLENYDQFMKRIVPELGSTLLNKLNPLQLQFFFSKLAETKLSPATRQHIYDFMNAALKRAVKMQAIPANPFLAVDRPKGGRVRDPQALEADQTQKLIEVSKDEWLFSAIYLMVSTGLRIGEALGLRWTDLEDDKLYVRQTATVVNNRVVFGPPKTKRSIRTVYLSPDVLQILSDRKNEQELERDIAKKWVNTGLIFTSRNGTALHPNNVRRAYRRILNKAGLPKIRVHDLRHTYVTLARDSGLDAEVIAHRVGQDVRVTMETYSQITETRRRKAALSLDALIQKPVKEDKND